MKEIATILLTTVDNPHSPFDAWTQWLAEDTRLGHDTCGLIARHSLSQDVFPDADELDVISRIIELNLSGKHIAVVPTDYDPYLKPQLKGLGASTNEDEE